MKLSKELRKKLEDELFEWKYEGIDGKTDIVWNGYGKGIYEMTDNEKIEELKNYCYNEDGSVYVESDVLREIEMNKSIEEVVLTE